MVLDIPLNILQDAMANNTLVAIGVIIAGLIIAKVVAVILEGTNDKLKAVSIASVRSLVRLVELLIFMIFTIIALGILEVEFARDVLVEAWNITPNLLIIVLLLLLGYILINLVVDILQSFFLRIGRQDYLKEFGVSSGVINTIFVVFKLFLYLVLLSITLNYYARPVPFFDSIITGVVFTVMFFAGALIAYSFKDYVANSLLSKYVEKNILKPGQRVKIGEIEGDVIGISGHGVIIETNSGYNYVIPNKKIVTKEIMVKRVRSNITKIEVLMKKFTPQSKSNCGPASASMLLDFFGYSITQEELASEAKTKVPGGTNPGDLIKAIKKLTNSEVRGQLIRFDEIFDLSQELKSWITEGAMVILWYKKPILFPDKESKSGHYVLCVGVEGEELIIMDPSSQTAGVYLVNHKLLEDAMDDYDISRGYIVFAKKGTSAFWRLNEGLIYGDVASYKNLSKSFERYLKRQFRQRNMINEIISEHLLSKVKSDKVKHVWKPDLTVSKKKQDQEKIASEENQSTEKIASEEKEGKSKHKEK